MCKVVRLSVSGYFAWRERPERPRAAANHALLEEIRVIHTASSGTYGSQRLKAVLRRHRRLFGHTRIERLMRREGDPRSCGVAPASANDGQSPRLSDRTQFACAQLHDNAAKPGFAGRHHLCRHQQALFILLGRFRSRHAQARRLVNERKLHAEGALEALRMAINRQRPPLGLIHHCNCGIQYASEAYRRALLAVNMTPSMSRKADCWDNAPMESFFHTFKSERIHHRDYITRDQTRW
jgi:putative transposase